MGMEEQADRLRTADPLNAEWTTLVLLVVLAVLAATNTSSPRKWRLLGQALFRMRLARQTLREEIDPRERGLLGLLLAAVAVLALFGWQVFVLEAPERAPPYPVLFTALTAVVVAQGVVLRAIAGLFRTDHGLSEYLATGLLLFVVAGLAMLPVTALLAYRSAWRPALLVVGAVLLALLLLYRWVRAAWIGMGEGVSLRHIILYLCAAEVVPVLLLAAALGRPPVPPIHP